MNSYLGFIWWDEETDGELMYPPERKHPTAEEFAQSQMSNPDEAAAAGNWSDPEFLDSVTDLNPQARHTQFADFHGHGWVFRAVFKPGPQGQLPRPRRQRRRRHVGNADAADAMHASRQLPPAERKPERAASPST